MSMSSGRRALSEHPDARSAVGQVQERWAVGCGLWNLSCGPCDARVVVLRRDAMRCAGIRTKDERLALLLVGGCVSCKSR